LRIQSKGRLAGLDEIHIETQIELRKKDVEGQLCDKASALQKMACSVGSIIAPIMGGTLTDKVGYRSTCDIVAGLAFLCSVVNFVLVFLPVLMQDRTADKKKENY